MLRLVLLLAGVLLLAFLRQALTPAIAAGDLTILAVLTQRRERSLT